MSAVPSASSDAATAGRNDTGSGQSQAQGRSQGPSQRQHSGRGEGSSGAGNEQRRASTSRTLADVMREPSTTTPGVMVLDSLPEATGRKDVLDPKEDLWLSTVDGRYSSPIIPLRVGQAPCHETFYVHKHVLLKSEYFEKALCGEFKESGMQSIDLPEENPAIFHFLVAYLYEGKYEPIRPAASVLVPDQDKGKGNAADAGGGSDSESASSIESDVSARSRRRHDRHRRREDRNWERMRQKHPGIHRPNCNCPQCAAASGPPCWSCRAPRNPPPYYHPPHTVYVHDGRPERQPRRLRSSLPSGP